MTRCPSLGKAAIRSSLRWIAADRSLHIVFEGYLNTKIFVRFVRDYLAPELFPGQVVLMDKLKIHQSKDAQRLNQKAGAEVLFLPPYMTDLSAIELCGSK